MASIIVSGDVSGSVTLTAPSVAGTTTLTLPTTSGTIVTTGGAASLTTSGNLTFTGTGNRITGDMSNATHANRLAFQTSVTNGATSPFIIPNGTGSTASIVVANASDPTNSSFGQFVISGTTDVRILAGTLGTGTSLPITFYTGGSERLRIDTSGRVGIGTTAPTAILQVSGTTPQLNNGYGQLNVFSTDALAADKGGKISLGGVSGNGATFDPYGFVAIAGLKENATASNFAGYFTVSTSNSGGTVTERMRIDSSGNLGLGVTPSAWGGLAGGAFQNAGNGALYSLGTDGFYMSQNVYFTLSGYTPRYVQTREATEYRQTAGIHQWLNAPSGTAGNAISFTERMRITAAGNLLVGTTTDGNQRIGGYRNVSSTTRLSNPIYWGGVNGSGADIHLHFTDSVANNYYFGGNNAGAYVNVNGSGGVRLSSGGTAWASDSDERLKDIIEPITDATNKVSTLRAVIGKYKTDAEGTRRSFLIAQDVQAVLPEAVVEQPDEIGTLTLAYTETIPLLVAAIQEQQTMIQELKARIDVLEGVK